MKKLISMLSILFLITLFVAFKQAEADRGSGGFRGDAPGCKEEDYVEMEGMKEDFVGKEDAEDLVRMGVVKDFVDLEGRKDSAEMMTMEDSVEMVAMEDFVGMGGSYPDCLSAVS